METKLTKLPDWSAAKTSPGSCRHVITWECHCGLRQKSPLALSLQKKEICFQVTYVKQL